MNERTAPARHRLNISQLIAEIIGIEMERDPSIVFLGEDIGYSGGTFGASRGFHQRFGEWRVRDTPISEMGFTGMAVGLSMSVLRPLVEIMSGGNVAMPVTIRAAGDCIDRMIGIYGLNNVALLSEGHVDAYVVSAENYRVLRAGLETPDKAALVYREFVREAV